MKRITDYIKESFIHEANESKTFTFNFDGIDDAEELLKSFSDYSDATVEDNKLSITINKDNIDTISACAELLQDIVNTIRSASHNNSDETYAQKTKKIQVQFKEMDEYIDNLESADDTDTDDADEKSKENQQDGEE